MPSNEEVIKGEEEPNEEILAPVSKNLNLKDSNSTGLIKFKNIDVDLQDTKTKDDAHNTDINTVIKAKRERRAEEQAQKSREEQRAINRHKQVEEKRMRNWQKQEEIPT